MSSWWETAKKILSGKPKGSKLIILGVFMVSIGVSLEITFRTGYAFAFVMLGIFAFMRGLSLYEAEVATELAKKREKK